MALPFLDSMLAPFAAHRDAPPSLAPARGPPRRMLAICNNLGLLPDQFFPKDAGADYTPSPYLELLKDHRDDFTVFSGVSHPNVDGGHPAGHRFLTAAPHPGSGSFRNTHLARPVHRRADRPPHPLPVAHARRQRRAAAQPLLDRHRRRDPAARTGPPSVFKQLFLQGTPERGRSAGPRARHRREHPRRRRRTRPGDLQRNVGSRDRDRLDQYFTSVRDLEHRLKASRGWERKPKPVVKVAPPVDPAEPARSTWRR